MSGPEQVPSTGNVFVRRNSTGQVVSLSRTPLPDHEPDTADQPDVIAFLQSLDPGQKAALVESDLSLIRALEDLIDVLIQKEVLRLTDLPDSVQAKLMARRRLRGSVRSLRLLSDDQETI